MNEELTFLVKMQKQMKMGVGVRTDVNEKLKNV